MIGTKFDRFGGNLVRFCYIVGAVLGIFAFFSHLAVSTPELTWGFGAVIAGALVLHEFLQTRRVLLILSRIFRGKEESKSLRIQFFLNVGILCVLLGFNAFGMWCYLTQVTTGQFPIPVDIANIIEAAALPLFGLVASLLMEVVDDAGVVLQRAASDMLMATTNRSVRQWKSRIKTAVENGHNLAPIAVDLMLDSGDADGARRVRLIEEGLRRTEKGSGNSVNSYVPQTRLQSAARALGFHYQNPPVISTSNSPISLVDNPPTKAVESGSGRRRRSIKLNPQAKVYTYMNKFPQSSLQEVQDKCRVDRKTAIKWRNQWKYEHSFERIEA